MDPDLVPSVKLHLWGLSTKTQILTFEKGVKEILIHNARKTINLQNLIYRPVDHNIEDGRKAWDYERGDEYEDEGGRLEPASSSTQVCLHYKAVCMSV